MLQLDRSGATVLIVMLIQHPPPLQQFYGSKLSAASSTAVFLLPHLICATRHF